MPNEWRYSRAARAGRRRLRARRTWPRPCRPFRRRASRRACRPSASPGGLGERGFCVGPCRRPGRFSGPRPEGPGARGACPRCRTRRRRVRSWCTRDRLTFSRPLLCRRGCDGQRQAQDHSQSQASHGSHFISSHFVIVRGFPRRSGIRNACSCIFPLIPYRCTPNTVPQR